MPTGRTGLFQRRVWYWVSILVLLDDAYRPQSTRHIVTREPSFNPCSSGWCLPAFIYIIMPTIPASVSILVLLDDAYRRVASWRSLGEDHVSILVLLDDAYRQPTQTLCRLDHRGFNPCSSGWCLPAMISLNELPGREKFQSLFFWMMPTGIKIALIASNSALVSILVLLDDAYRQFWRILWKSFFWVSILVLLDDAYRPEDQCKLIFMTWRFQSLFFWMMPTGPGRLFDCVILFFWFQSLFFWMMPTGLVEAEGWNKDAKSFNPCSSGWCLPALL